MVRVVIETRDILGTDGKKAGVMEVAIDSADVNNILGADLSNLDKKKAITDPTQPRDANPPTTTANKRAKLKSLGWTDAQLDKLETAGVI